MSLGQAVVEVGADASGFGADLSKQIDKAAQNAAASIGKIGKNTTQVGKKLSLGLTVPLVGAAGAAIKTQAQFEQSMNLIAANIDGATAKSVAPLGELAKQLGKDTVFSAGEAASAMLELAKGGFSQAQISGGAVQATMALAATEGLQLADAATITSNAMNAFGISADKSSTIADALAGASAASSASVESLSQALSQVGPGAKNAGLTLQDTVGVLAAFDQAGIKGSDAGTSLKTMLTRLVPQTKQARDAMQALGLMQYSATAAARGLTELGIKPQGKSLADTRKALSDYLVQQGVAKKGTAALATATDKALLSTGAMHSAFVDNKGSFKDIGTVAGILQKKLGGLTEAQKTTALNTIFGSDATRAASVLMNDGAKGINKYIDASKKQGSAQKLSDARMKGTAGAIEQMKGSIDTAALAFGTALAPTVVTLAGKLKGLADWFTNLDSSTQHTIAAIAAVVAIMGPLLIVLGSVFTATSKVITGVTGTAKAVGTIGKGVKSGVTALGRFRDGFKSAQTAQSQFSGKMGTLGGAVRKGMSAFASGAKSAASWAASMGKAAASAIASAARATTAWVVSTAKVAAAQVASAARATAAMVAQVARQVAAWVLLGAQSLLAAAKVAAAWLISMGPIILVGAAVVGLVVLIVKNWDTIKAVTVAVFGAIGAFIHNVWAGITAGAGAVINWVKGHWPLLLAIITGPIGLAVLAISKNWDAIKTGAGVAVDWVKGKFSGLVDFFRGLPGKIGGIFSGLWSGVAGGLKSAINSVLHLPLKIPVIDTHIPGVGKVGGQTLIPALAQGGIVTKPTLALIGEKGPEAVIPLRRGVGTAPPLPLARTRSRSGSASYDQSRTVNLKIETFKQGSELTTDVTRALARVNLLVGA